MRCKACNKRLEYTKDELCSECLDEVFIPQSYVDKEHLFEDLEEGLTQPLCDNY